MGFPMVDTTPRSITMRKQRIKQPARAARSKLGRRSVALALALALLLVAAAPPTGKPECHVGQSGLREAGIDHRHAFQRNGQLGL